MSSLSPVEQSKRLAAFSAVKEHFPHDARYVGIGSGSTVVYVVQAIAALGQDVTSGMIFVPTGSQSRQLILDARLSLGSIDTLPTPAGAPAGPETAAPMLDVAFDGADEVDDDLNCIKGGGACLYLEKLVAINARKFVVVADQRKLKPRLLTTWPAIPIEVHPLAAPSVLSTLRDMGSLNPVLRPGLPGKAGPIVTDNGMYIVDAPFKPLSISTDGGDSEWSVPGLAQTIKSVVGVFEVGIFTESGSKTVGSQKPVAAYFGMDDGSVTVKAEELGDGKRKVKTKSISA